MALIGDLWSSVPPITRTILLISIILTGAVSLDLCTPFKLYFNYNLIKYRCQVSVIIDSIKQVGLNNTYSSGVYLHACSTMENFQ